MHQLKPVVYILLALMMFQCKEVKTSETKTNLVNTSVPKIVETVFIDSVWAANMVSFDLHTMGNKQYVAYYDKNRMMTVASRDISSNQWQKKTLSNKLHWDSHNYVVMGFDEEGYIHISGNMHNNPLVYFRSEKPYDITSIKELNDMVGCNEDGVTYPKFFNDKDGHLLYTYRTGGSGSGNNWVNKYNTKTKAWERYLKTNLFEGISDNETRSSYFSFTKGPDGNFHFTWVWRWTPLVETTHQLCYAVSPDLIHWKNAFGEPIELPLKPDNEKLIVDNAPTNGGMHNGKYELFLTENSKPIIGYIKYDEDGLTQLYVATTQNGTWISNKISDWNFRWEFIGGGDKMTQGASFDIEPYDANSVIIKWSNETGENGTYLVDTETLHKVDKVVEAKEKYPSDLKDRLSKNAALHVNIQKGKNSDKDAESTYVIKWESMGKSHGSHAPEVIPEGPLSALYLINIK
ncbi:BNR repeat-containing protein [Mariniflexile sp.]|uniref:BNR repeat-containing protein n=1 Tax=Mariniflexile sp. TaxID=1979402 RepID=UPI0040489D68